MIQFDFLSGQSAGTSWVARRFPVRAGRAADNDLRLEEPGVFDRHFEVAVKDSQAMELTILEPALACVNGQPVTRCVLRNGDRLDIGSARLRFWLAPTRQTGLRASQAGVWLAWLAVLAAQIVLLRWLNS